MSFVNTVCFLLKGGCIQKLLYSVQRKKLVVFINDILYALERKKYEIRRHIFTLH